MSKETYTIARMAERSGLSVPTLRFYESEGLIPPVPRDYANNRVYGEAEVSRIDTIRCLRAAGLTLPEMRRYFDMVSAGEATIPERRELLRRTQERLSRQLSDLQRCMDYLTLKLDFYDRACAAQARGLPLPEYSFARARSVFDCPEKES